jgi:ABC-2 type transport system permease protein
MDKIIVILQKEWLDMKSQRMLLLSVLLPPLIFTILPIIVLYATGQAGGGSTTGISSNSLTSKLPILAGMSTREAAQALIGLQFSSLYVLMPLIIPSIIAAYSIIGEKTGQTLEPVLATPIRTWELLLGKCLASFIPAIVITWISGAIFVIAMALVTVSTRVFSAIISPGWFVLVLLWAPLLALIAIAVMTAISSRVNDPRTAQQFSAWVVVPFLAVFFGQLSGLVILGLVFTLVIAVILAPIAALALWAATGLFQREVILTRWK